MEPGDGSTVALTELKERLRRLRFKRRLSMAGLERRAGLGHTTSSQALNGPSIPTEATVAALAQALRTDPEPLLALRRQAAAGTPTGSRRVIIEPRELADGQPPLIITAETGYSEFLSLRVVDELVDIPPDRLPRPDHNGYGPLESSFIEMMTDPRPTDNNKLSLTVEGRTARAVILDRLRIRVLNRRAGSKPCGIVVCKPELPYSRHYRKFLADLRSDDTVVPRPLPIQLYGSRELTALFPYVVHSTEPEMFAIHLCYGDEDVEWIAELGWRFAGRSGALRIDNAGAPFVSTPFSTRPIYRWGGEDEGWGLDEKWPWSEWIRQHVDPYVAGRPGQ
jgi:transcriptional regulator with XRE-family HTH domain